MGCEQYSSAFSQSIWSYTRVSCFQNCKYEFYLGYINTDREKYPVEDNFYAAIGRYVHKILALIINGTIKKEDALSYYVSHYDENITAELEENASEKTKDLICDYVSFLDLSWLNGYQVLGVEEELTFELQGYRFIGYIDLLLRDIRDGRLVIVDHKSAEAPFKRNGELKKNSVDTFISHKRQMYLYSHAVKQVYGEFPKSFMWNHYKDNGKMVTIPFSNADYNAEMDWYVKTIQRIAEEKNYDHSFNYFYCNNLCNFRSSCKYNSFENSDIYACEMTSHPDCEAITSTVTRVPSDPSSHSSNDEDDYWDDDFEDEADLGLEDDDLTYDSLIDRLNEADDLNEQKAIIDQYAEGNFIFDDLISALLDDVYDEDFIKYVITKHLSDDVELDTIHKMIDNIYDEDFVKKVFLERFHGDVNEDIIEALIDNMFDEDFIKTVVTEYLNHPISSKLKKAISEYCYDDIDFSAIDSKKTSDQTQKVTPAPQNESIQITSSKTQTPEEHPFQEGKAMTSNNSKYKFKNVYLAGVDFPSGLLRIEINGQFTNGYCRAYISNTVAVDDNPLFKSPDFKDQAYIKIESGQFLYVQAFWETPDFGFTLTPVG